MDIQEAFDLMLDGQMTWDEFKRECEKQGWTVHVRFDPMSCSVSKIDKRGRIVFDLM